MGIQPPASVTRFWEELDPIFKTIFKKLSFGAGDVISEYFESAKNKRIESVEKMLNFLADKVNNLEGRIISKCENSDDAAELINSVIITSARTRQEIKLRAAASILTNVFLKEGDPDKLNFNELDLYIRCVDSISIGAINVLGHVAKLAKKTEPENVTKRHTRFSFEDIQKELPPELPPSLLMGFISELNNFNLLHNPGTPRIKVENYKNYIIELTPLGAKFVFYLLES